MFPCYTELCTGSPPRVRGIVLADDSFTGLLRITPACAGNSLNELTVQWTKEDHPRVCGE